jgi:hypothetical protein
MRDNISAEIFEYQSLALDGQGESENCVVLNMVLRYDFCLKLRTVPRKEVLVIHG